MIFSVLGVAAEPDPISLDSAAEPNLISLGLAVSKKNIKK
jgi:hypothetical protein